MANQLQIPFLSPVKLVVQDYDIDARYHTRHFAPVLQQDQSYSFQQHKQYYQKWQTNDTVYLQMVSNFGPTTLRLVDCQERVIATGSTHLISSQFYTLPDAAYSMTLSLSGIAPGYYFFQVLVGSTGNQTKLLSEPQHIEVDHPNTILFEYNNSSNTGACIFQNGETFSLRAEAVIQDYQPGSNDVVFEDQTANLVSLSAFPFEAWKLIISNAFGSANWVAQKLNRIFGMDKVLLDGKQFTRESGAKMERSGNRFYPLSGWELNIRDAFARNTLTVVNDYPQNELVQVIYVYDSAVFGGVDSVVINKHE